MATDNDTRSDGSPQLVDLTVENITKNTKLINSQASNPRLKFLMDKLIDHLHAFARETRLTTAEWRAGLEFITECGQICNEDRQELDILSGILGLNVLVDALNNPKLNNATESTMLGPFYKDDAPEVANGETIASPGRGEVSLVLATVKDTRGAPIEGVKIDVWETDQTGHYDCQYSDREKSDMRGRLTSDKNGEFYFKCVKPVSYPIADDGPAGRLLRMLNRHPYRPAHIHFRIRDPNEKYNELITALYIRGDPYESSDAVLDVKTSLIVDALKVEDASVVKKYNVREQDWLIKYDFVLTTPDETQALLTIPTHV
jgi:protocatechuate 3,4-dioxygenase beta subunit